MHGGIVGGCKKIAQEIVELQKKEKRIDGIWCQAWCWDTDDFVMKMITLFCNTNDQMACMHVFIFIVQDRLAADDSDLQSLFYISNGKPSILFLLIAVHLNSIQVLHLHQYYNMHACLSATLKNTKNTRPANK